MDSLFLERLKVIRTDGGPPPHTALLVPPKLLLRPQMALCVVSSMGQDVCSPYPSCIRRAQDSPTLGLRIR